MILECGKIYFVNTINGENWLFKYKDGEYKTSCSLALCIDDMWSDGHGGNVCADASIVYICQANRNYIAMFNHIFEDE